MTQGLETRKDGKRTEMTQTPSSSKYRLGKTLYLRSSNRTRVHRSGGSGNVLTSAQALTRRRARILWARGSAALIGANI